MVEVRPLACTLVALWLVSCLDPTTAAACPSGPQTAQTGKGAQLMPSPLKRIRFERSGGFYHQPIGGTILFHDDSAEVTSGFAGGSRTLSQPELRRLQALDLAAIGSSALVQGRGAVQPGPPEGYQFDVTIETADGHETALRFHEEAPDRLDRESPGLGDLAAWIRREVAALWRKKAGAPPAPG